MFKRIQPRDTPRDPTWQAAPAAAGAWRRWLTDRGSLTQRIEARAPGMQVKLLFEGRRRLHRDERFLARGTARALTRDVLLVCGAQPVVYAHSVLRPSHGSERGVGWRLMRGMGARPLGAALFADPRIRRLALRQQKLPRGHELHRCATRALRTGSASKPHATSSSLWARRSLFRVGNSLILVSEVFLPGVLTL